jgi:hypothetical protein
VPGDARRAPVHGLPHGDQAHLAAHVGLLHGLVQLPAALGESALALADLGRAGP